MGCCANKGLDHTPSFDKGSTLAEELSREEKIIIEHEKQLQFTQSASKDIIRTIKSEGLDNSLSLPQLKRAFLDLNIPESSLTTPESPIRFMLTKLQNEKKLYDMTKLTLIGILVGKGTPAEKTEWLFRQYDTDASGMLDLSEINQMINDLIEVSINVLPSLARGDGVGFMNKEELDGYKAMLLSGKARLVEEILKILMVDREVSQVELTQKICDPSNVLSKLLWSYGIRSMAKKHSTH